MSTSGSQIDPKIKRQIINVIRMINGMDPINDWHYSYDEPKDIEKPIVYVTNNGKIGVFKNTKHPNPHDRSTYISA